MHIQHFLSAMPSVLLWRTFLWRSSFFFLVFIYLFMAALGPRLCARALPSCGSHPSSRCTGLPLPRPLPLQSTGSAIVAHGPSRSAACGILPDQGPNPCPPHWQADSQLLRHQGSPDDPLEWLLYKLFFLDLLPSKAQFLLLTFKSTITFLNYNVIDYIRKEGREGGKKEDRKEGGMVRR